ncbi:sulfate reduction electron transfer complex DsrMKJOP subunit DsrK [Thioalkalivibrio sp. HK1]|uniref:sulfate reduction electron transfer complex DsrMKJOP subunit DsrK n=1 Tax=Thioalkalivibrio sp. HK1 TaxID=1469245 RepID=UPI00046E5604|nr:(Fe-S)-binding protein [Thioalkalivibrio sp. HK1]
MSKEKAFEAPPIPPAPQIPALVEGAMSHSRPFVAEPEHQRALGFPGELVDDWHDRAIEKMGDLLHRYRGFRVFLDACVKCGACTDKCHYFLGTGDPKNMPVGRQDLLRKVYRRHFTLAGKFFPKLVGAADLSEEMLDDWYRYFHQCSQCRRCSVFCPYGIDTAEVSMAGREILASIGMGQKYSNEIIGKVHRIGNNLGLPQPALAHTLEGLEEDIEEETGVRVRLPLDQADSDILLVTPSADFFAEPHVDGLIGYAKVFHQAGLRWTLSTKASEAANFGLFIGSYENMRKVALRIRDAALDLGARRIVFGECGHAWRVAYNFLDTLAGPLDFLDPKYPAPQHIVEVTHDLISRGALRLDPSANDERRVTFHDSCNIARASRMGEVAGGQFALPRDVLRSVCNHVFEMDPDATGERTFCCGGGGGLLTDDLVELRVKGSLPRMQAFKEIVRRHRVSHLVAICAICKSQFSKVLPFYGFTMDQVLSLHQLVGDAIVLGER